MLTFLLLTTLVAAPAAAVVQEGEAAGLPSPGAPPIVAARDLLERAVLDPDGGSLGSVRDVVVGADGSACLLLSVGGSGLVGAPLPPTCDADLDGAAPLRLAVRRTSVLTAPILTDPARADGRWLARTHDHYALAAVRPASPGTEGTAPEAEGRVGSRFGPAADPEGSPAPVAVRLQELLGQPLVGSDGRVLGRIEDVVLSLDGSAPTYALLGARGPLGAVVELHGVAWSELRFDAEQHRVIAPVGPADLQAAPPIDRRHLPHHATLPVSVLHSPQAHPRGGDTMTAR